MGVATYGCHWVDGQYKIITVVHNRLFRRHAMDVESTFKTFKRFSAHFWNFLRSICTLEAQVLYFEALHEENRHVTSVLGMFPTLWRFSIEKVAYRNLFLKCPKFQVFSILRPDQPVSPRSKDWIPQPVPHSFQAVQIDANLFTFSLISLKRTNH